MEDRLSPFWLGRYCKKLQIDACEFAIIETPPGASSHNESCRMDISGLSVRSCWRWPCCWWRWFSWAGTGWRGGWTSA